MATPTTAMTATVTTKVGKTVKTSRQLLKAHPFLNVPPYDPAQTPDQQAVYDALDVVWSTLGSSTLPWYGQLTGSQRRLVRAAIVAFGEAIITSTQEAAQKAAACDDRDDRDNLERERESLCGSDTLERLQAMCADALAWVADIERRIAHAERAARPATQKRNAAMDE